MFKIIKLVKLIIKYRAKRRYFNTSQTTTLYELHDVDCYFNVLF